MKKILCAVLFVMSFSNFAFSFSGQEHTREQLERIWGFNRETLLEVNRRIDTLPGKKISGTWGHRTKYGHSDLSFSQNWEYWAEPFKYECPELTRKELKALTQNAWDIHMAGDSTTGAATGEINMEALRTRLKTYSPECASACNKNAALKAFRNGTESKTFVSQSANIERMQAENLLRINKDYNFKILGRNNHVIITPDGGEYVIAMKKSTRDLIELMRRFPDKKFALTPEDLEELSKHDPELAKRAVTFKALGDERTRDEIFNQASRIYDSFGYAEKDFMKNNAANVKSETRNALSKSALKKIAPYAQFGAFTALTENWQLIQDAYDNKAEWSKALSNVGIDFAGYTATPALIDGVLVSSGTNFGIVLKNAGAGFTLGYFAWSLGKEYFSYRTGEISDSEFNFGRKKLAAREIEMLPVNVLAYIVSVSGHTMFVPVVIIAGSFAIQRLHEWHEEKRWLNTVYVDEMRTILGEDMLNAFTLIDPERRSSIADPERRDNLAEPSRRKNLAQP